MPHGIILLYHRVAELPLDPQLLSVTPQHFAEHLDVMRKCGRASHISGLSRALESRNGKPCVIAVTFDDGYADNLYGAKPLLEHYDVPATVFVTAGYLGSQREFWYDELERILLHTGPLPQTLGLKINVVTNGIYTPRLIEITSPPELVMDGM
jgi:peptidoglycan/xylan/chitin deacetylase (PgdA/CDA1 family)